MNKSFLELLEDLKNSDSQEQKAFITSELSFSLEEDEKYSERILQSFFAHTLAREVGSDFKEIVRGDFFRTRVKAYIDEDYTMKIAVGIAYLQDMNIDIPDLDRKVLEVMLAELKKKNLDLLINDISVNQLQYRNGSSVDLETYGG